VKFRLIVHGQNLKANPVQFRPHLPFGPNITVGFVVEAVPLISVNCVKPLSFLSIGWAHNSPKSSAVRCVSRLLNLFKHYRFGNKNVAPDSFFSAGGRVEGLKTWYEQAGLGVKRPASGSESKIYLRFDSLPPTTSEFPKSVFTGSAVARKYGIRLHVLRSQNLMLAGMEGLEEVYLFGNKDDDELRLSASWKYQESRKIRKSPRW
jgi:hypothetical protein